MPAVKLTSIPNKNHSTTSVDIMNVHEPVVDLVSIGSAVFIKSMSSQKSPQGSSQTSPQPKRPTTSPSRKSLEQLGPTSPQDIETWVDGLPNTRLLSDESSITPKHDTLQAIKIFDKRFATGNPPTTD